MLCAVLDSVPQVLPRPEVKEGALKDGRWLVGLTEKQLTHPRGKGFHGWVGRPLLKGLHLTYYG